MIHESDDALIRRSEKMKTVIVNGGSSGIGKQVAEFLLSQGYRVIITSSNEEKLKATCEEMTGEILMHVCDVSNKAHINRFVEWVKNLKPYALITFAGILGPVGKFAENDFEQWERTIKINLIGVAELIQRTMPILLEQEHPKIITIGGGGAANSRKHHTAYAASKTGLVRLTEIIGDEYKEKLDINIIAPGAHKTPIWEGETHDKEPEQWADITELYDLVNWLLSDDSNGISGRFIHIKNNYKSLTPEITGTDRYVLRRPQ